MKKITLVLFVLATAFCMATVHADADAEAAALASLDDYMAAFNARDEMAWAATLNFPHVRIAGDQVRLWKDVDEYADYMDFDAFTRHFSWDHSAWDQKTVVQSTHNKVHIAVTFSRYDKDNTKIATFESMYIVTLQDGHWGTQARSSFAP